MWCKRPPAIELLHAYSLLRESCATSSTFPRQTAKLPGYCEHGSSSGSLPVTHGMSFLLAHRDQHIPADCRNLILFSQQGGGTTEQDPKLYCRKQAGFMKINNKYKRNARCQAHSKWQAQNSQFNNYFG